MPAFEFDINLTERQAGVLPTAIEDAQYFRDEAAGMAEFSRGELQKCIDSGAEESSVNYRAERIKHYELEHYRASRLVAFLEKLKESEG